MMRPPEVLLFQHLPAPRHRLGIILLASTKWSASRPDSVKSPKTPNFGQFGKNPTLYKPRHGLFIDPVGTDTGKTGL